MNQCNLPTGYKPLISTDPELIIKSYVFDTTLEKLSNTTTTLRTLNQLLRILTVS